MWLSADRKLMCTDLSTTIPLASCNTMNGETEQKEGRPLSARIIEDVDRELEALEIVFRANSAAVEELTDRNGHRRRDVVKDKSVSRRGERTKGEGRE